MRNKAKIFISTGRGDSGFTDSYYGVRLSKDDARCEACGTIDELCSFLGFAKSMLKRKKTRAIIEKIQSNLFIVGSEIAVKPDKVSILRERINVLHIKEIEDILYQIEKRLPKRRGFIIPGKNKSSAILDVCRTVARRLERRIVSLKNKRLLRNTYMLKYVNRISDLLYLLARTQEYGI